MRTVSLLPVAALPNTSEENVRNNLLDNVFFPFSSTAIECIFHVCSFSGCCLLNQVLLMEKCYCSVRMLPNWWKPVNAAALLFQMLLGFWGFLNNCALKKKTTKENHNPKPANPSVEKAVSSCISGVAECCIMIHSIVFQIPWKYLCTVLGWAEPPCPLRQWEDLIMYCLFRQYPSWNLWAFHVCRVIIQKWEVFVLLCSWVNYSSLEEWTAVAWLCQCYLWQH